MGSHGSNEQSCGLCKKYVSIQHETHTEGIDAAVVRDTALNFFETDAKALQAFGGSKPKPYTQCNSVPDDGMIRLVAMPLGGALAHTAHSAAIACMQALQKYNGDICFVQKLQCYHVTVSFLSLANEPVYPESEFASEANTISQLVQSLDPPELVPYSLILTRQGVLILALLDQRGSVHKLRDQIRQEFPSAPYKQPEILHVSLLRLTSCTDFESTRKLIESIISKWTPTVREQPGYTPSEVWVTKEKVLSDRHNLNIRNMCSSSMHFSIPKWHSHCRCTRRWKVRTITFPLDHDRKHDHNNITIAQRQLLFAPPQVIEYRRAERISGRKKKIFTGKVEPSAMPNICTFGNHPGLQYIDMVFRAC